MNDSLHQQPLDVPVSPLRVGKGVQICRALCAVAARARLAAALVTGWSLDQLTCASLYLRSRVSLENRDAADDFRVLTDDARRAVWRTLRDARRELTGAARA